MKFFIQICKGVIRDTSMRRSAMFAVVVVALLFLFAGMTFLSGWLLERPGVFLLFWGACAWLTFCAVLMALYDLLATRAEARREKRRLKDEIFGKKD